MKNIKFSKLCDTDWVLGIQKWKKIIFTEAGSVLKLRAPKNNCGIKKWILTLSNFGWISRDVPLKYKVFTKTIT